MTGHEPVEIKANVLGEVERALAHLELSEESGRTIWFLEASCTDQAVSHPLFDGHVILRLRGNRDGSGDSTIKIRPCRRLQLTEPWQHRAGIDAVWDYKIEGDWARSRHVLAASCQSPLPAGALTAALRPGGDLHSLFTQPQWDFLAACGALGFPVHTLRALGPIAATQWKKIPLGGFKVVAERWQLDAMDFLELSIRVDPSEATPKSAQEAFEQAVRRAHIDIGDNGKSKTQMVLEYLSTREGG